MNFLTLVKRLATETGTELEANIESVDLPPAVGYGETTEHRSRLINWIKTAWEEVQEDQDQWDFMVGRIEVSINTGLTTIPIGTLVDAQEGETIYDVLIPFVAAMDYRYIWLVDDTTSQAVKNKCYYVPPEQFFGSLDRHNSDTVGLPTRFSISRNNCIIFNTTTNHGNYSINMEFKKLPQELENDASVPRGLPDKHHMVIVYKAMLFYAGFDATSDQYERAKRLFRAKMNKLRRDELREYSLVGDRS